MVVPLVATFLAACSCGFAQNDDALSRYMDQLRARGFLELAEGECLRRLEEPDLSPQRQIRLVAELAETLLQHGWIVGGEQQPQLWDQADQRLQAAMSLATDADDRTLLRIRSAEVAQARGAAAGFQWELWPERESLRQTAIEHYRLASTLLEDALNDNDLSTEVAYEARSRRIALLLDWAEVLSPDDPQQSALITQAETLLTTLQPRPRTAQTRSTEKLLAVRVAAARGRHAEVLRQLPATAVEGFVEDDREAAVALRAEALIAAGRYAETARELLTYRREAPFISGKIRVLNIEALSGLRKTARDAQDQDLAREFSREIERHVTRLDAEVGGYWAYRGRLLWERIQSGDKSGDELPQVLRSAASAFADGNTETAVTHYLTAFEVAARSKQVESAVDALFAAASIEIQQGRHDAARSHLSLLIERFPEHPRAADAHLLEAYAAGRQYAARKTATAREDYETLLEEHLQQFGDGPTGGDAAFMLAELQRHRLQTTKALVLYRRIPFGHARWANAVAAIATCHLTILERLDELHEPAAHWQRVATDELDRLLARFPADAASWTPPLAQAVMDRCRMEFRQPTPNVEQIGHRLDNVLQATEQTDSGSSSDWDAIRADVVGLRMTAWAMSGNLDRALPLVQAAVQQPPATSLAIIQRLEDFSTDDDRVRRAVAELRLQVAEGLLARPARLSDDQRHHVQLARTRALVDTNQPRQAIDALKSLLQVEPIDDQTVHLLATLLVEEDPAAADAARTLWQRIEQSHPAGSPAWWEARYFVALCEHRLGHHDECRKLLGVAQVLYARTIPADLKLKLADLAERCAASD